MSGDELAADSIMAFAGTDGELPDNAPGWEATLRRFVAFRRRVTRLHLRLADRPKHFPLRVSGFDDS